MERPAAAGTPRRRIAGLVALALAAVAVADASAQPVGPAVPTVVERIAGGQYPGVIHGWHANRIIRVGGSLYATGLLAAPAGADERFGTRGIYYRREADGTWTAIEAGVPHLYSTLADPQGRFWAVGNAGYDDITVSRSVDPGDPTRWETLHRGVNFYSGVGMGPEGNVLAVYAETQDFDIGEYNSLITAFYDHENGRWYRSRIPTPEGRYGYVGIILRGRRALAVLNSALRDPKANPVPPHYTWRHVRLAWCDDLRRGRWVVKPWLMPAYGSTTLQDLVEGPDGAAWLVYSHVGGRTREEIAGRPALHYVARITMDRRLRTTVSSTHLAVSPSRLFFSSGGTRYIVGRPAGSPTLWLYRLDPAAGYLAAERRELPGTEGLREYMIYPLRPDRFGGEGDGDTVHLVSAEQKPARDGEPAQAVLWYASFRLPE